MSVSKIFTIAILAAVQLTGTGLYAQFNPDTDLDKYWWYRARLVGDAESGYPGFVLVGEGTGHSIPMSGRNPAQNCETDYWINRERCGARPGYGKLRWVDATIHMGHYMAVLALEYHMLRMAGDNTERTEKELYYVLKAIERLDYVAYTYVNRAPQLDGFFIRDDVHRDFYMNEETGTYRFLNFTGGAYHCIQSSAACGDEKTFDKGFFVSQDQIISLFFGFRFVRHFAADARYPGQSRTVGQIVADQTHRIMQMLRRGNWRITGPEGKRIPNVWGGDVRAFSYPLAESAHRITEGYYMANYHNRLSRTVGRNLFRGFDWAFGLQAARNRAMSYELVSSYGGWTLDRITRRAAESDQIMYALAYAALQDLPPPESIDRSMIESMIRQAPFEGPCYGSPNCNAPEGWRSAHRWIHPTHKDGNPYGLRLEWNGLDFMLLYNLYHYLYSDYVPAYKRSQFF